MPDTPEGVQLGNSITNSSDSKQLTAERCFTEDRRGTERAKGPITILALTKPEDLQFLMDSARQEALNLCLIHFAQPCGTCTAARKRKLPSEVQAKLKDAGITPPQRLRSEQLPMELPGIAGSGLHKVEQANKLYFATRDLALLAISLGIRVAMENPTDSLFWKNGSYPRTFARASGTPQYFSQYMMGGERQKQTTRWCKDEFFLFV